MKFNLIKKITFLTAVSAFFIFSGCQRLDDNDIYIVNDVRKTSDVLVIMYMSGDANNGNNFLPSVQQAEDALTYIRNSDDTPKSGYKSVNVVALFDGAGGNVDYVKSDSNTRLLELGRGFHNIIDDGTDSGLYDSSKKTDWSFSSNTVDLSSTVSWIYSNGRQEVNMSSGKILTQFLNWVNQHYKANQVIIAFGDHGGGPCVEVASTSSLWDRSIIFDDDANGDKNYYLRTGDIVNALSQAGFTGSSRPEVLIEDLCLGASIEEIYGLKGSAHYFLGSPNITYGNSMGYYHFITNLASGKTIETVCKEEVDNFAQKFPFYKSETGSNTFTFADLTAVQQLENIKTNINQFAQTLMSDTTKYNELIRYIKDCSAGTTHIMYEGSFVDLKDMGWLFEAISKDFSENTELTDNISVIEKNLSEVILYAFGSARYYTNHENGSYSITYNNSGRVENYNGTYAAGNWYGLTVSVTQQSYIKDAANVIIPYENCSLFGSGNKWGSILRY